MKYVRTFESFKNINKIDDSVNEEFLGKLFSWISKKWSNWQKNVAQTKGGKEVEVIYQKYLKMLNDEMARKAGVELNIMSADKLAQMKEKPEAPKPAGEAGIPESAKYRLYEADEAAQSETNQKLDVNTLKQKKAIMDQIIDNIQARAKKEMNMVLSKMGGAGENPKLAATIQVKLDQFDYDVLQAKIKYLEKGGDKTLLPTLVKERDLMNKKLDAAYKNIAGLKAVKFEVGDKVIYLLKDKDLDDWYKLSEEDRKNPESDAAKAVVGVKKIEKTDGKTFTFKTNDGGEFTKQKIEIIGKAAEAQTDIQLKKGDIVTWKNKEGKEIEREIIDIKGDVLTFMNANGDKYTKKSSEVTKKAKEE